MQTQINWNRLKNFKCPKCNDSLYSNGGTEMEFECNNKKCGFKISKSKFDSIIVNLYQKKEPLKDNQEMLNNL